MLPGAMTVTVSMNASPSSFSEGRPGISHPEAASVMNRAGA